MARKPRFSPGGLAYHVMNRTWQGVELFEDDADYQAFEKVLAEAVDRHRGIRLCAYCLMPNHFHLVVWPKADGQLSRFMQWLSMTHAARWHAHRQTGGRGHLYQSRFRSFPIQQDDHFLGVCRYVERNALRANLVSKAQDWRWSSLWTRPDRRSTIGMMLSPWPVAMPARWTTWVNQVQTEAELAALRRSRDRGQPYGEARWTERTAKALGTESSLRSPGRPKKEQSDEKGL
jgi:putative transposase